MLFVRDGFTLQVVNDLEIRETISSPKKLLKASLLEKNQMIVLNESA